ncbi:sulfonate ABC transporter permease [Lachnoclostridium sp. An14]|uniref:ABC transporter permease n=1 Tax=Lachnoclostridium sp. An14 TaxID=1965562 RepID=UPI000B36A1B1|nr:ABC transporter permease [Lachnoclostridium sp. An14]OUQ21519.1 sulfonate ABC transporter permease [Lachnoclostridium sp. An14]
MTNITPEGRLTTSSLSPAQAAYLARERFHRKRVSVLRTMLFILLLALWELGAETGAIDDFIFSSPSRVVLCFLSMAENGAILHHIGVTLYETALSFFLVVVLSLLLAVLLWSSRSISQVLEPYLVMLNSLPKSALAPLLIVWLGANLRTIVVAAVSVAVFGSVMTLYTSFTQTDRELIRLIRSLGGGKKDVLVKILLPASVPVIISSMKVSIGLCLVGVIIGEFLAARAGLGYLIIYGQQTFAMDEVVLSIAILCVISALFYKGISLLEKRVSPSR